MLNIEQVIDFSIGDNFDILGGSDDFGDVFLTLCNGKSLLKPFFFPNGPVSVR